MKGLFRLAVLVALTASDDYVTECLKAYPDTFRAILVHDPALPDVRRRVEAAGAHGVRLFDLDADPGLFAWLAAEDLKLWAYLHPPDYPRLVEVLGYQVWEDKFPGDRGSTLAA